MPAAAGTAARFQSLPGAIPPARAPTNWGAERAPHHDHPHGGARQVRPEVVVRIDRRYGPHRVPERQHDDDDPDRLRPLQEHQRPPHPERLQISKNRPDDWPRQPKAPEQNDYRHRRVPPLAEHPRQRRATAHSPTPSGKHTSADTPTHRTSSRARSAGAVFANVGASTSPSDSPTTLGGTSATLYAML